MPDVFCSSMWHFDFTRLCATAVTASLSATRGVLGLVKGCNAGPSKAERQSNPHFFGFELSQLVPLVDTMWLPFSKGVASGDIWHS